MNTGMLYVFMTDVYTAMFYVFMTDIYCHVSMFNVIFDSVLRRKH